MTAQNRRTVNAVGAATHMGAHSRGSRDQVERARDAAEDAEIRRAFPEPRAPAGRGRRYVVLAVAIHDGRELVVLSTHWTRAGAVIAVACWGEGRLWRAEAVQR